VEGRVAEHLSQAVGMIPPLPETEHAEDVTEPFSRRGSEVDGHKASSRLQYPADFPEPPTLELVGQMVEHQATQHHVESVGRVRKRLDHANVKAHPHACPCRVPARQRDHFRGRVDPESLACRSGDEAWGPYASAPGFHAKEFFARDDAGRRTGPYQGWDDLKAEEYLSTLLGAITSLRLYPIGALVDVQAFHQYTEDERRHLTAGKVTARGKWIQSGAPTKPYFLAFWKAVTSAVEVSDRTDWKIEFVFDLQTAYESLALSTYARLKKELDASYSNRLGAASFESRRSAFGLQAADALAYSWHQYASVGPRARPEVHRILSAQRTDTIVAFTGDMMDKLLGRSPTTPGSIYVYDRRSGQFVPEVK
jgi:hypothetical protein